MTFGSLFSGIGGIDIGLERAGFTCRWQVENDPYCQDVLKKHWPHVARFGNIQELNGYELEKVDLIAGGFPCQPVSIAGKLRAQADERWLWPEMARLLRVLRPRYVLVENVPGLLIRGMGDVLRDLAALGFDAEWSVLSACSLGAPHVRKRLFIVAHTCGTGLQGIHRKSVGEHLQSVASDLRRHWEAEPNLDRVADGVPRRLVGDPIRSVGNSVVPACAEYIGRMILEDTRNKQ